MSNNQRGRPTSQPPHNYKRPEFISEDGLTVTVVPAPGERLTYTFVDLRPVTPLLFDLVRGFARCSGPTGSWVSPVSQSTGCTSLRMFYRYLQTLEQPPTQIEQLTATVWNGWMKSRRRRAQWNTTLTSTRILLRNTEGLPNDTLIAMRHRLPHPKWRQDTKSLNSEEFKRTKLAAWQLLDGAGRRIEDNLARFGRLEQSVANQEATAGDQFMYEAMRELLLHGRYLKHGRFKSSARITGTDDLPAVNSFFLTPLEAFAGMLLFAALRGYTPGQIYDMQFEHQRADGGGGEVHVRNTRLEKARRGLKKAISRDNLVDTGKRSAGGLYRRLIELTTPARGVLAARNFSTDLLFVARSPRDYQSPAKLFMQGIDIRTAVRHLHPKPDWLMATDKHGQSRTISLHLVRRAEQVLNREPRFNSDQVHDEIYVLPDDGIVPQAADIIIQGQLDAVDHAESTMKLRLLSEEDLSLARDEPDALARSLGISSGRVELLLTGQLDTPVASCLDFEDNPHNEGPCRVSFLLCLACTNAVAGPRHLPRLVALRDALETIASAVASTVWLSDYKQHYDRLQHLLSSRFTPEEVTAVKNTISNDEIRGIELLLERKLDA